MPATLEVCVDNFESVRAVVEGGGTRVELCSSLLDGGLTPSYGFLKLVKEKYPKLLVFAMIRPRGGDFCYCDEEIEIMKKDIDVLKKVGADGFVFGCLTIDGMVDMNANNVLLKCSTPMPCTFHRAFDMSRDATQSLQNIIALGFTRILTSGQAKTAFDGLEEIKRLVQLADGRIIIMPGSGVSCANVSTILTTTKAQEYHSSCSELCQSSMRYRNASISMGQQTTCSEYSWKVTNKDVVRKMIDIVNNLSSTQ